MSRQPLRLVIAPTPTKRTSWGDYSGSELFLKERQEAFIRFLYLLDSVKLEGQQSADADTLPDAS
jgi:hypothetical protein